MSHPHSQHTNSQGASEGLPSNPPEIQRELVVPDTDTSLGDLTPSITNVMEAVYDLGPAKRETFEALRANPGSTTRELSEILNRDRSNVNRSLTVLLEAGLVKRRRRLLRQGGYIYQYTPRSPREIEVLLQTILTKWTEAASVCVSEFAATTSTDSTNLTWVERVVLTNAGEMTATEEFVFYHGVENRRRAGEQLPQSIERGEWSPGIRREFVESGSWDDVLDALDRLQAKGFIEDVKPAVQDNWAGSYWRLTPTGEQFQTAVS